MWYGFTPDGRLGFETFAKSQKIQNLRRDPRITALVEDGDVYEQLRGVELVGTAEVTEDPGVLCRSPAAWSSATCPRRARGRSTPSPR